jgi:hypothetical protein
VRKITDVASTANVVSEQATIIKKFAGYAVDTSSEFSLSSQISRTRPFASTQSSTTAATISAVKTTDIELDLTALTAELIEGVIVGRAEILAQNFATMAVDARAITDTPVELSTTCTVSVQGINTLFGQAQMQTTFVQTSTEDYLRRNEVFAESTTELLATISKFTGYRADFDCTTELSAVNGRLRDFDLDLQITSEQTTVNDTLRLARADLESATEQTTQPGILVRFEADLASQGFVMAVGTAIRLDPYLQLRIKPETRSLVINPESRQLDIEAETRILNIQGYQL